MTNLEKYKEAFMKALEVEASDLEQNVTYQGIKTWDSVGHMTLIEELEEAFDIMMDTDDIIDLSSYEKGKEILAKYGVEI